MLTSAQLLVLIGFAFQIASVLYQIPRVFANKMKYIEREGMTVTEQLKTRQREWFWTSLLVFIGLAFQVASRFV